MSISGVEHRCHECNSPHVVNIILPVPSVSVRTGPTRRAHRCLDCTNQWPPHGSADPYVADVDDAAPTEPGHA